MRVYDSLTTEMSAAGLTDYVGRSTADIIDNPLGIMTQVSLSGGSPRALRGFLAVIL